MTCAETLQREAADAAPDGDADAALAKLGVAMASAATAPKMNVTPKPRRLSALFTLPPSLAKVSIAELTTVGEAVTQSS